MRSAPTRATAALLLFLNLAFVPAGQSVVRSNASIHPDSSSRSVWLAPGNLGTFVRKLVDGRAVCVEATVAQAGIIKDRDSNLPLTPIVPDQSSDRRGLNIVLRSTSQLKGYPQATEAFKRAAAQWEALIDNT